MKIKNGLERLKKKKKFLIAALVVIIAAGGYVVWQQKKGAGNTQTVQLTQARVTRGDIVMGLDSDGSIAFSTVKLGFGVQGKISQIMVNQGDTVEAGSVIAKLDDREYQNQYLAAEAKLKSAQEQKAMSLADSELSIKKAEAELQSLRNDYEEMEAIPNAYSENEIKAAKLNLDNKELEYQNMLNKYEIDKNDDLAQEKLAVTMARENLDKTALYSPISGVVLSLAKKVGESVADNEDVAVIYEGNKIKADTNVIEYDVGQIKVGQKVYVSVEAVPDKKFEGVVSKVDAVPASDTSGLVNYAVEVDITDPGEQLKDGMTCSITFVLKEVKDCLIVPYKAVKVVDGKQYVSVIDANGQTVDKNIKTGFTDGSSVEVLEGLSGNETVVYQNSR
ncbi:MAG: efflux RND transporter periplasmic adaptor subunit [Bacillota bacterium]